MSEDANVPGGETVTGDEAGKREAEAIERFSIGRLNSFSDAVFAVAITLLVLSIQTLDITGKVTETKVLEGLGAIWPHFFAYALSFIIVGAFWVSHHRLFEHFRIVDYRLLWINLLYLMMVVFVPYPTALLAKYGETITVTSLYAGCMCLIGLLQALLCWYGSRYHSAQGLTVNERVVKGYLVGSLDMSAVFLMSIGIAFWSPDAAKYFWLILIPLGRVERVINLKAERRKEKNDGL